MIPKERRDPALLNCRNKNTLVGNLGIEFTEIGEDFVKAKMPVDERTKQPIGLLSGGASAAFAETVGSTAAFLTLNLEKYYCVGLELKCNHIRSTTEGFVYATATPVHVGRKTHVWKIEIVDEQGKLISFCTHTIAVLEGNRVSL
jgi:1,4-dihydroxy-2-naphthoyl-CoA hydrolase